MTTRLDLHWQLSAVLPHAGTDASPGVGLETAFGYLHAYATDRYTVGVARTEWDGGGFACHLPVAEAKDLSRFVKPTRKAHEEQSVLLAYENDELHVGWETPGVGFESAVFETSYATVDLSFLLRHVEAMASWPRDDRELIVNPDLSARFSKAKRLPTDRMHLWPVRSLANDGLHGCAVVAVGSSFVGAVAGLGYEQSVAPDLSEWFVGSEAA